MTTNDDQKFLHELRKSPISEKLRADTESARLERRHAALEGLRAFSVVEQHFREKLRAAEATTKESLDAYEEASAALQRCASDVFCARLAEDTIRREWDRAAEAIKSSIQRERNPRISEIFFAPLQKAIEEARSTPIASEQERIRPTTRALSFYETFGEFKSSAPAIVARIEFLQRALNLASEHLLSTSDTDDELIRIRDSILDKAPLADALIVVEKTGSSRNFVGEFEGGYGRSA